MADILIRGMKIPQNCDDCFVSCLYDAHQDGYKMDGGRPNRCPLIALPEGHGRLIDADAFDRHFTIPSKANEDDYTDGVLLILDRIEDAPTIVPAEKEEKKHVEV